MIEVEPRTSPKVPPGDGDPPTSAAAVYRPVAERLPLGKVTAVDWPKLPPTVKRYPADGVQALPPPGAGTRAALLSALLQRSFGLTRYTWEDLLMPPEGTRMSSGRPLRPVPSAGGLFPSELYAVLGPDWQLPSGLYHVDPARHALDTVRPGDRRASILRCLPPATGASPAYLVVTSCFHRSAFKYGEFGYRLQCLEAGALVAQLQTVAAGLGLVAEPLPWFADGALETELAIEPAAETTLALLSLGWPAGEPTSPVAPAAAPPDLGAAAPTRRTAPPAALGGLPVVERLCGAIRAAGQHGPDDGGPLDLPPWPPSPTERPVRLPAADVDVTAGQPARRSARGRFGTAPLTAGQLAGVLRSTATATATTTAGAPWEGRTPAGAGPLEFGCVLHEVTGIERGAYHYTRSDPSLHPVRVGDLRVELAPRHLASSWLTGDWRAGAILVPLAGFWCDGAAAEDRWYRTVQLAAGAAAHRACLAAQAFGLTAKIVCGFEVEQFRDLLALADSPLRPLCLVLIGSAGSEVALDWPLTDGVHPGPAWPSEPTAAAGPLDQGGLRA